MSIKQLAHAQITIPTRSEATARAFYCGLLGLQEIAKPDSLAGRGGFWLRVGGLQVHVGTEDGVDRWATKAHLAYLVDDLDQWRRILQDNDVEIEEQPSIPDYRRFLFRDPFGNRVEFLEQITSRF